MSQYKIHSVSSDALANAFQRAHHFLTVGATESGVKKKLYTIHTALNMAVGHNLPVLYACRHIIRESLENKSCSQWLIDNGVPEEEVRGKKGFYGIRIWKQLWLQKLADSWNTSEVNLFTFKYPF